MWQWAWPCPKSSPQKLTITKLKITQLKTKNKGINSSDKNKIVV
jgi:hypothetical protein